MFENVIVGAGPYGLSLAAHFRRLGVPFRIFGRPMDSWRSHMPKGMLLKSDGFASNISDPDGRFTLKQFCSDRGIEYSDSGLPVSLDTFAAYGLAFRDQLVPELEEKLVTNLERLADGFRLELEDGQTVMTRRVVLAVGITHFEHIPDILASLPREFVSHSFRHSDLESFKRRSVVVVGGGSSAIDLAALLKDVGSDVQIVARTPALKFHDNQGATTRSLWDAIRRPKSGLGPGLRSRFFSDLPMIFHYLPERLRLHYVRTHLGPAGGWFSKQKVLGRVPLQLGCTIERAEVRDGRVSLALRAQDGSRREISAEHIIAATGYRVDLRRLKFLNDEIRPSIRVTQGTPILSSNFESSIPGLYFVGISAANSFGPLMRFAYGADFAARRVTQAVAAALVEYPASVPATSVAPTTK
jgi:thioredoxin reductase